MSKEVKPLVNERFADNGEHSHWELIDPRTGEIIWTEEQLEQRDRQMIADAWDACNEWNFREHMEQVTGEKHTAPHKQEYIDSILKNNQP